MDTQRRSILATAAVALAPLPPVWAAKTAEEKLVLSNFNNGYILPGAGWRGFSDRVMGGISNVDLKSADIAGKQCIRMRGDVTRESNGGFIQMALYFGRNYEELNGSDYKGIEVLVYGNNEDYNLHVRTADCGWHDQSYRATFFAEPSWQRLRFAWSDFQPNRLAEPLDSSSLQRIAVLGWMREFKADVALAEISLYS